ncbi:synaptojanin-2-binding protein-like [Tubulanus polymorphus]|uniref:synaptojanin-2-binding protein-like n=1 Tax=Tubulanus polymorphus TaxID=672921 RepID=UPI003DA4F7F6
METNVVNIKLERGEEGLGFNIRGGKDAPYILDDPGIFITKIRENGAAAVDNTVNEGDQILEVNGVDVRDVTHCEAVNLFLTAGQTVQLLVKQNAEAAILAAALSKSIMSPLKNGKIAHNDETTDETHSGPYIPPPPPQPSSSSSVILLATGIAVLCVGLYLGYRRFRR